ncbi:MAG: hypothetical protein V4509_05280 [Patescibacteria group bacterium]
MDTALSEKYNRNKGLFLPGDQVRFTKEARDDLGIGNGVYCISWVNTLHICGDLITLIGFGSFSSYWLELVSAT